MLELAIPTLYMLDGSGSTQALETWWPRKVTEDRAKWNMDGLSLSSSVEGAVGNQHCRR